jgi:hypothetical protein
MKSDDSRNDWQRVRVVDSMMPHHLSTHVSPMAPGFTR